VAVVVVVTAFLSLVVSARAVARLYTDWLWFGSLELRAVWTQVLATKLGSSRSCRSSPTGCSPHSS